jgi:hypothetical protein
MEERCAKHHSYYFSEQLYCRCNCNGLHCCRKSVYHSALFQIVWKQARKKAKCEKASESILLKNLQQNTCVILSIKVHGNWSDLMHHNGHSGRTSPAQATSIRIKCYPWKKSVLYCEGTQNEGDIHKDKRLWIGS